MIESPLRDAKDQVNSGWGNGTANAHHFISRKPFALVAELTFVKIFKKIIVNKTFFGVMNCINIFITFQHNAYTIIFEL